MAEAHRPTLQGIIVEEHVVFTFTALCRASGADAVQLQALVGEGVVEPTRAPGTTGTTSVNPDDWHFSGNALPRARTALRLARDFELSLSGAALVMDLLAEIEGLRSRLQSDVQSRAQPQAQPKAPSSSQLR